MDLETVIQSEVSQKEGRPRGSSGWLHAPTWSLGLIPGQGARSFMPQLKTLCATIKTWRSQINTGKRKSKPQWGTISHQSEWLQSKSLWAINAGEGVEKREPSYTVGGNGIQLSHYGEHWGDAITNWNRTAIQYSNPTAGHTHRGNQNWERHEYPNFHHSTADNSQDTEAT